MLVSLFGAGREKGEKSAGREDGQDVVDRGVEGPENVEGRHNDQNQEEGVVVEYGEGGGLVIGDLILLPQNPANNK